MRTPIAQYFDLKNDEERLKVLCQNMNLLEPLLIGTYTKVDSNDKSKENSIFKFTNLINPYTGSTNVSFFPGTEKFTEVFYNKNQIVVSENLIIGSQYLFSFGPYGYNSKSDIVDFKRKIVDGKLIKVIPGSEIELMNIALKELENKIPINKINIPIIKTNDNENWYMSKNFYVDYFAAHVMGKEKDLKDKEDKIHIHLQELKNKEAKLKENIKELKEKEEFISKLFPASYNKDPLLEENLSFTSSTEEKVGLYNVNKSIINTLQANMKIHDNLNYEKSNIENIIAGIQANLLIILYGPSGTGKTSIISSLANHLGANYKIIPVQSSWLDRQDLFGYFNPISKMYTSTPFLDTILEAKKDLSHLYFIGLDEMNLSQVEHYLADVLSLSEHKIPIPLYSKQEYEFSLNEVQWYLKQRYSLNNEEDIERLLNEKLQVDELASFKYLQQLHNLLEFPHELELPPNLRFIGTINNDGSTKALSPKVIDRSLFIEMKNQREEITPTKNKTYKKIRLIVENNDNKSINMNKKFEDKYSKLNEILKDFNAQLNKRTLNHIVLLEQSLKKFNMQDKEISDAIIYNKILPKINIYLTQENNRTTELAHEISALTDESSKSSNKFKKMTENFFETKVLSFWE